MMVDNVLDDFNLVLTRMYAKIDDLSQKEKEDLLELMDTYMGRIALKIWRGRK